MAHVHSTGSAHMHSARGPQLAGPASACTARRASTHRSGHRSLSARRGAAGDATTMAEVEQRKVLEHPRRRGYPSGMGVEAIAHRSSLSTGRGRKTGSAAAFSDEARAPVAGGGPATARREGKVSSTLHGRRTARGELGRRSPWSCSRRRRRPDSDDRGARTATVGFGPGDGAVGTSEVRRLGER